MGIYSSMPTILHMHASTLWTTSCLPTRRTSRYVCACLDQSHGVGHVTMSNTCSVVNLPHMWIMQIRREAGYFCSRYLGSLDFFLALNLLFSFFDVIGGTLSSFVFFNQVDAVLELALLYIDLGLHLCSLKSGVLFWVSVIFLHRLFPPFTKFCMPSLKIHWRHYLLIII